MNIEMLDADELTLAHARAVEAVRVNIPKCSDKDAEEIVDSIVTLVFATLKQYLPGQDVCN